MDQMMDQQKKNITPYQRHKLQKYVAVVAFVHVCSTQNLAMHDNNNVLLWIFNGQFFILHFFLYLSYVQSAKINLIWLLKVYVYGHSNM